MKSENSILDKGDIQETTQNEASVQRLNIGIQQDSTTTSNNECSPFNHLEMRDETMQQQNSQPAAPSDADLKKTKEDRKTNSSGNSGESGGSAMDQEQQSQSASEQQSSPIPSPEEQNTISMSEERKDSQILQIENFDQIELDQSENLANSFIPRNQIQQQTSCSSTFLNQEREYCDTVRTCQTGDLNGEGQEGITFNHYANAGIMSPEKTQRRNSRRANFGEQYMKVNSCCVSMKQRAQSLKPKPKEKKEKQSVQSILLKLQQHFKKQEYDTIKSQLDEGLDQFTSQPSQVLINEQNNLNLTKRGSSDYKKYKESKEFSDFTRDFNHSDQPFEQRSSRTLIGNKYQSSGDLNLNKQGSSGYSETTQLEKIVVLEDGSSLGDIEDISDPNIIKQAFLKKNVLIRKHTANQSMTKSLLLDQGQTKKEVLKYLDFSQGKSNDDSLKKQSSQNFQHYAGIKKGITDYYPQENQQHLNVGDQIEKMQRFDSDIVNPMSEDSQSQSNTFSRASRMDEEYFKNMGTANFNNDDFNPFVQNESQSSNKRRSVRESLNPFSSGANDIHQIEEDLQSDQAGQRNETFRQSMIDIDPNQIESVLDDKRESNSQSILYHRPNTAIKLEKKEEIKIDINSFDLTKKLGQGAYGKVYLATKKNSRSKQEFAIKTLSKEFLIKTNKVQSVFREKELLSKNKICAFLPKFYYSFADEKNLYIVMEYIHNGTLQNLIKKQPTGMSKSTIQFFSSQIVFALEYLQSQNVAHRDLKPGNIMICDNFYIKVIDFGEAKVYNDIQSSKKSTKQGRPSHLDRRTSNVSISDASSFFGRIAVGKTQKQKRKETFVGTPMYCAPEMLEENNQAGLFTDLWALGCIMYEMASGQQMFRGKNNALVYDKIQKYDVDFSLIKDADLRDLIIKLTDVDPQKRIGLQSINEIKNHRFFNGFNFDLIQKQQLECPPLDCNLEDLCDDTADKKIAQIEKQSSDTLNKFQIVQSQFKSQVLKHGIIKKRNGLIIKKFKEYDTYLLSNGIMVFYTADQDNKKFGQESNRSRLQIDETLRVEKLGQTDEKVTFSVRIGGWQTVLETLKTDEWFDAIQNFKF